jgi:hypothetical protein
MAASHLAMTIGLYVFLPLALLCSFVHLFILATSYVCTTLTIAFLRI